MKIEAWKTYVLTETIANPMMDRRRNDWRYGASFPEGLELHADADTVDTTHGPVELLSLRKGRYASHTISERGRFSELWALIVPKLECRETPQDLLDELHRGHGCSAEKILLYMLEQKQITELELRLIASRMVNTRRKVE